MTRALNLGVMQEEAWRLLRDVERLANLIASVQNLSAADQAAPLGMLAGDLDSASAKTGGSLEEKYVAHVIEKVGPFRLDLNLDISIVEADEPSLLQAEIRGTDRSGQNRISGMLTAELKEADPACTLLNFDASVEVLGKLASLGATPIRRRANELFDEFANRVAQQFSPPEQNSLNGKAPQADGKLTPELSSGSLKQAARGAKISAYTTEFLTGGIACLAALTILLLAGIALRAALLASIGLALLIVLVIIARRQR